MKHLIAIAQKPHPTGSPENNRVRSYILQELSNLGLNPEIQSAAVVNTKWGTPFSAATVRNVVAKLKGSDNTRALMLAAHYDSIPTGPGAGDDASGVATILETIRAVRAGAALRNDLIILMTDGEELGLLGAKAFVDESPLVKEVGLVLNFEARGTSGPSLMFETSNFNGWLIQEFAKVVPYPVTSSLLHSIYERMPNDTDLTMFRKGGLAGLNFAFVGGLAHYHTRLDNPFILNERSIQHNGSQCLALTRHFGNMNLKNTEADDVVFFNLFRHTFYYPRRWIIPLTIFITGIFMLVLYLGLGNELVTWPGIIEGVIAFLLNLILPLVLLILEWWAIRTYHNDWFLSQGDTYNRHWFIFSYLAFTLAVSSLIYQLFRKKTSTFNLTVGSLICWLGLLAWVAIYFPGGSFLLTWPLLFNLIACGIAFTSSTPGSIPIKITAALLSIVPAILLLAPVIILIYLAMNLELAVGISIPTALLLFSLFPHLGSLSRTRLTLLPILSALAGLLFVITGVRTVRYDERHPKPDNIFYVLNADTGGAVWASTDRSPDQWTSQFFRQGSELAPLPEIPLFEGHNAGRQPRRLLQAPAPTLPLSSPEIQVLQDQSNLGIRTLHLHLSSKRKASVLMVFVVSETEILDSVVNGKQILVDENGRGVQRWSMIYAGTPAEGIDLVFQLKPSPPFQLRVADQTDGLPEISNFPVTPRPNDIMPRKFEYFDLSTLVSKSFSFNRAEKYLPAYPSRSIGQLSKKSILYRLTEDVRCPDKPNDPDICPKKHL